MAEPLDKELKLLEDELNGFSDELLEISLDMIREGYTEYPVYIAHKGNVEDLGELLFDAQEYKVPFSINVSMIEDLVEASIIPEEKLDLFKTAYGDPKQFMCIFLISGDYARFIFYPFAKRNSDNQ